MVHILVSMRLLREGNVTASASNNTYTAAKAFDDGGNTMLHDGWQGLSCQMYGFLMILLNLLKSLTIPSSRKVGDTKKELQKIGPWRGPNDNSTWETLDSETNQTGWGQWETRRYSVSSPNTYRYYKLVISDNNGDGTVGVGEIQYFTNPNSQVGNMETRLI